MRDVLVLCYHAVSDRWPCELAVSPELLDEQVAGLKRRGYRATTFTRAITDPPWRRTMAITFDDAYRSTLEQGLPVLARHDVPATVYAPTDFVGADAPDVLARDRAVERRSARSTSCSAWGGTGSPSWPRPAGRWARTRAPIRISRRRPTPSWPASWPTRASSSPSGSGSPCESIAYPYGDFDERVVRATGAAGYRAAGTLTRHAHPARPLSWPRVGVYPDNRPIFFRLKTSATLRRVSVAAGRVGAAEGLEAPRLRCPPPHEVRGGRLPGEGERLAGPQVHPVAVALFARGCPQGRGQEVHVWVGRSGRHRRARTRTG